MDNKTLIVKCMTLLYRESELEQRSDDSNDLVKTVMDGIKTTDINLGINTERDVVSGLKQIVLDMCRNPVSHVYDLSGFLQTVKLGCAGDDRLYESIKQGVDQDLLDQSLKRSVVNLRKMINNHYREDKISEVLNKASYQFKHNRDKIRDINQFLMELNAQLEPLQINNNGKDPAILGEVDIGDITSTSLVFDEIKASSSNEGIMSTGFIGVNRMLQGGLRRGETLLTSGLQHNYKTGFTLTLFKQLALYNKPYMLDPTKKPLLLRISFEDDLRLNLQFLYQALKESEGLSGVTVDVDTEVMSNYIKEKLSVNGYHTKMLRVDPNLWTYKHLCNKVVELEAQGYEIHVLMVDYLAMLPTTGCTVGGPIGSDRREMLSRVRNFTSPKKIIFITPHQLSSAAKQMLREGRQDLVKEIVGLGFYEGCSSLENGTDIEIHHHIEKYQKEAYLTIQRGKHRLPSIIPDHEKYCVYKFPPNGPIPDDLPSGIDSSRRKVGSASTSDEKELLFEFNEV